MIERRNGDGKWLESRVLSDGLGGFAAGQLFIGGSKFRDNSPGMEQRNQHRREEIAGACEKRERFGGAHRRLRGCREGFAPCAGSCGSVEAVCFYQRIFRREQGLHDYLKKKAQVRA